TGVDAERNRSAFTPNRHLGSAIATRPGLDGGMVSVAGVDNQSTGSTFFQSAWPDSAESLAAGPLPSVDRRAACAEFTIHTPDAGKN
ncbi:MAG: hypothetical protein P8L16_07090, partial [Ilumatobacter sp.]|nr:hypothetical protein [Ilumatobacter sp.]